jgi:hypothetical protein
MKFTSMFFKASEDYIRDSFSNIATNERDKQSPLEKTKVRRRQAQLKKP